MTNGHAYQCSYIPDGYTLKGFIAQQPGLHGALNFTYRPMLQKDRVLVIEKIRTCPIEKSEDEVARVVAARVKTWDLTHPETGAAIEISSDAALHLQSTLLTRLWNILIGDKPTDINPDWAPQERKAVSDDAYELALKGTDKVEEDAAKN